MLARPISLEKAPFWTQLNSDKVQLSLLMDDIMSANQMLVVFCCEILKNDRNFTCNVIAVYVAVAVIASVNVRAWLIKANHACSCACSRMESLCYWYVAPHC